MDSERRHSVRIKARLLCEWQDCENRPTLQELDEKFAKISSATGLVASLQRMSRDIQENLQHINDHSIVAVLTQMQDRNELIGQHICYRTPATELEMQIGVDGFAVTANDQTPQGTYLAIHLQLPTGYHVVAVAQAIHSHATRGYEFLEISPTARRYLQRYVLQNSKSVA